MTVGEFNYWLRNLNHYIEDVTKDAGK